MGSKFIVEEVIPSTIGGRLCYARKQRNLTQKEVAERAGIHWRTLQGWELNQYQPRLFEVSYVADALNVSLDWLAGRID